MENIFELKNVSKSFEVFKLTDINMTLRKGYIMGLIGQNGAGKTTTIRLILNMLKKDRGEILVFGKDNIKNEIEIKEKIGVVLDSHYFVSDWNVQDISVVMKMMYKNWNEEKYERLLKRFNIDDNKKVKDFSKGMQMKTMVACAFSYDAQLLILDEPTSGLDPVSRDDLLTLLQEYIEDGEHSVLFSTHVTSDLDRIADYITYLQNGRVFYTGNKDEFIDCFRIIKGGNEELNRDLKLKLIGLRTYHGGFEALIKTQDAKKLNGFDIEPACIDDIIVFTSKDVKENE